LQHCNDIATQIGFFGYNVIRIATFAETLPIFALSKAEAPTQVKLAVET
jgi:hypothetical protein